MSYKNSPLYTQYKKRNKSLIALQAIEKQIGCRETAKDILNTNIHTFETQILDAIKLYYYLSNRSDIKGLITFKGTVKHTKNEKFNEILSKLQFSQAELAAIEVSPEETNSLLKTKLVSAVKVLVNAMDAEINNIIELYSEGY